MVATISISKIQAKVTWKELTLEWSNAGNLPVIKEIDAPQ